VGRNRVAVDRAAERAGRYLSNSKEASSRPAGPPSRAWTGTLVSSNDCNGPGHPPPQRIWTGSFPARTTQCGASILENGRVPHPSVASFATLGWDSTVAALSGFLDPHDRKSGNVPRVPTFSVRNGKGTISFVPLCRHREFTTWYPHPPPPWSPGIIELAGIFGLGL